MFVEFKRYLHGVGDAGMYVCVAPPMVVGKWSMAVMLWQLYEYYY